MENTVQIKITVLTTVLNFILGMLLIGWWLGYDSAADLVLHLPGMDGRPDVLPEEKFERVEIGAFFSSFDGQPADLPGEWTGFRGNHLDAILHTQTNLKNTWPAEGPQILWSIALGEGHAAPAIKNGRLYILDYMEEEKADALRCFSLADGKEIWRRWYTVRIKRNHGLSRTIPAVTDQFVVTMGPRCHVMCVDAISGDLLWAFDFEKDFGTETPFWYTGQCPIIENDVAVLAPAGDSVLLMGVDCATGEILWQTPNTKKWNMSHSSITPMVLHGQKMYVYSAVGGLIAVEAEGENAGTILWESTLWTHSVIAPSPLQISDNRIFLTAGYGAGSMVIQVDKTGEQYSVQKVQEYKPSEGIASEQQTPIYTNGYLFSIQPKDAGILRNQFVCYHPDDCTELIYSSGREHRFGLGPYVLADHKMYILDDEGLLTMAAFSISEFKILAQSKILEGPDAWGPLAIAGTRLLARDSHTLVCIELGE